MTQMFGYFVIKFTPNFYNTLRTLMIYLRLTTKSFGFVVFFRNYRVSSGQLIHTGGAVPKVLSCDVDGHLDVKLEIDHFKRGRMPVPKEISDEPTVSTGGFGTVAVGNTGGLDDGRIQILSRHVINETNKPMIEHFFHYT